MTGCFVSHGSPEPMRGHRGYIGVARTRYMPPRLAHTGHMERILDGSLYRNIDNSAEAMRKRRCRELYSECERAPWGWENRL